MSPREKTSAEKKRRAYAPTAGRSPSYKHPDPRIIELAKTKIEAKVDPAGSKQLFGTDLGRGFAATGADFEREFLALLAALKKWRHCVHGSRIVVHADNVAL